MRRLVEWLRGLFGRRREPPRRGPHRGILVPEGVDNRRAFPRMKLDMAVQLQFASAEEVLDSRVLDISRGGMFLRTPQPRPEGTHVRVGLAVGDEDVVLRGVVVRSVRLQDGAGAPGIGVMFTDLGEAEEAFLERVLSADDDIPLDLEEL